MVDLKRALAAAIAYCQENFAPLRGVPRFEEVESDQYRDREVWEITLSWERPYPETLGRSALLREYKIFTVDKKTGEVVRVRMHELAVQ